MPKLTMEQFEYISDVSDKIEDLIEEAKHIRNRKEKREKLKEAQELADFFVSYCRKNGNNKIDYNPII